MVEEKSPVTWALTPLKKYAQFSGRAPRAEWWWYFLFTLIIYLVMWFVFAGSMTNLAATGNNPSAGMLPALGGGMIIMSLVWLALIIPTIAVQMRRVHDTNRSGWWVGAFYLLYILYLAMLVGSMASVMSAGMAGAEPSAAAGTTVLATGLLAILILIYAIVLLVFFCLPGTPGPNIYGPEPYGAHENLEGVFS